MTTTQKVRAITAHYRWSQKGLAMELGVSPSHFSDMLSGRRRLKPELLERLEKLCPQQEAHSI